MPTSNVTVVHDLADELWFVQSSDIPGLNAEAATYEGLVEVILDAAPDLVEANLGTGAERSPHISICVQHTAIVPAHRAA